MGVILMARTSLNFGMLKVEISDTKSSVVDITNLAYNTMDLLIPKAEKFVLEERKQIRRVQSDDCDCEGDDAEECPMIAKEKEKEVQKQLSELYV
jgi:hypothetical protein